MSTPARGLTPQQVQQLIKPIAPSRVLRDGKGHSHVSQQDILAHLIRVFGFGNFDIDVLSTECVFEQERANAQGVGTGRFDVCYRAMVRLTVRDPHGQKVAHYENGSTATAQNQSRGDAHDLAYKSAISLSVKRAAIAFGDQFGLSLYNKGQMAALVRGTLVGPEPEAAPEDVQEGVPQQVSLGNDEIDRGEDEPAPAAGPATMQPAPQQEQQPVADPAPTDAAAKHAQSLADEALRTSTVDTLRTVYDTARGKGLLNTPVTHPKTENRMPLSVLIQTRKAELLAAAQREQLTGESPEEGEAA